MTLFPDRNLGLALLALCLAASCARSGQDAGTEPERQVEPAGRPPDVVVVVLDSLRADELLREVGRRPVMPRLAAWARSAVVFRNARAPSCSTPTSVAALFTSLPVPATGVDFHRALPDSALTLAQVLRRAGYATRGYSANPNVTARLGLDRGFDELVEAYVDPALSERVRIQPHHPGWIVRPERLIERAWTDLLGAASSEPGKPQFVYLHLLQPHAPYQPPAPHRDMFVHAGMQPVAGSIPEIARHDGRPLDPAWLAGLRARYDEHVHWADAATGELLDRLAAHPRFRDAAVIVLSDHGEAFGEHGRLFHNTTVFEEMLRIPLLVRVPGAVLPRAVVDAPVDLLDVAPTICRLAGIDPPPQFWGHDLLDLAREGPPAERREFLAVARPPAPKFPPYVALVSGRLKLIRNERSGRESLFDLEADPEERSDLSAEQPQLLEFARGRLDGMMSRCRGLGLGRGPQAPPLREEIERLRSLGYTR
ncbi:MAG: choline-sulfatase [Acidobacteriota bacterium]